MHQREFMTSDGSRPPAAAATVIKSVQLFGVPVQAATLSQALDTVHTAIMRRESLQIGVVNAAKIVNMKRDPKLREAVHDADVIYADGMSVVWASRILGKRLPERVAGIDLMTGVLKRGQQHQYRVYCLGANLQVVERVCDIIRSDYPGVVVAGWHDGYFSSDEEEAIAAAIRDAKPDVLFVAITTPKKEQFMARWGEFMMVPVVHGVGGSFDVVAGVVARAPESWRRLGLEWLYRVKQEPRRLWKRYLVTNVLFTKMLLVEILKSRVREH